MVKKLTAKEALEMKDAVFIDTRSPKEFAEDNIPHSISSPIFTNEERKVIGTLYRKDQDQAYDLGLGIYQTKVEDFIKKYKEFDSSKPIIVYCWRGGLRSETITKLIESLGHEVYQLEGGYKAFREIIRDELKEYRPPFKLMVLQGLAGCGKTDLIKKIKPSIDLEGLAAHRSSLFGALGLKPQTQKMFESRLWEQLQELKNEKIVFIEGEAKKIGNICVPKYLFEAMEKADTINIQTSLQNRVKRIVRDYFTHEEDAQIKEIIIKLKVQLSNKAVEELCAFVDAKNYEPVAEHLLVNYYDERYDHANKDLKYAGEINNDSVDLAVKEFEKLKIKFN